MLMQALAGGGITKELGTADAVELVTLMQWACARMPPARATN
jgi:hypothetical protein